MIESYLLGDPEIADNMLGEALVSPRTPCWQFGGGSKRVARFARSRKPQARTGSCDPSGTQSRIITNTPREFETAQEIVRDLPNNCAGKTIDVTTAQRRAGRAKSRQARADKAAKSYPLPNSIKLYHSRFQELDRHRRRCRRSLPTYPMKRRGLGRSKTSGSLPPRVLAPGGLVLMMSGIQYVDIILEKMARHLSFQVKLETLRESNTGIPCYVGQHASVISSSKPIWFLQKALFSQKKADSSRLKAPSPKKKAGTRTSSRLSYSSTWSRSSPTQVSWFWTHAEADSPRRWPLTSWGVLVFRATPTRTL